MDALADEKRSPANDSSLEDTRREQFVQELLDSGRKSGEYLAAVETLNRQGFFVAPFGGVDLITKKCYTTGESVALAPYGISVLKRND